MLSAFAMWSSISRSKAKSVEQQRGCPKPVQENLNCFDDDEISSYASRGEGLECPICWESFNVVENVPYVLWCGHTLCKNCILGLHCAVVKLPTLAVQLPFFISCPWCNLLSFRLVYKGDLKLPSKNFFLLWMIETMNGDRDQFHSSLCGGLESVSTPNNSVSQGSSSHQHPGRPMVVAQPNRDHGSHVVNYLQKSLFFFVRFTAKFPLVIILFLIVVYAIPGSAAILVLYILVTILFTLPSFLILYFAYPSLDWLVREIFT